MKKKFILCLLVILLIVSILFCYINKSVGFREKLEVDILSIFEGENVDDITMTIYYTNPLSLTRLPWTVDMLIDNCDHKIVVDGSELKRHFDIFGQIDKKIFIPVLNSSNMNARVYYTIESKKNGNLFEVAMWGEGNSMFVNGVEIKENGILYDIIIPFLPEEAAQALENVRTTM